MALSAPTTRQKSRLGADPAVALPPGYKRTDLGLLPDDWNIAEIGHLKPFVTSGSRGWARFYSETGAAFIRITNLSRESIYIDLADLKFVRVPPDASAEAARTGLQDGDLLISITADIGIVGFVDASLEKPAFMNQHIALVRFDRAMASSRFVAYYLASEGPQRLFIASMDVGAKAGMNLTTIRKIRLALPLPPEQAAIAEALSDVDGLLGALEALTAKKQAIKQAAMQQLLTGKTRLPGFRGEWKTKRLGEIAAVDPESLPSGTNPAYRFNYISLEQVDAGRLLGYSEEVFRNAPSRARRVLRPGDVLLSTVRPNLMAHLLYRDQVPNAVCSTGFAVLRARPERSDSGFLYAHLFAHVVNRQIERTLAGSNYPAINSRDVKLLEIPCPPEIQEQTAVATVLSNMDAEIAALEQRSGKTRAIKQGMMQQLLTGRTRLVKPGPPKAIA